METFVVTVFQKIIFPSFLKILFENRKFESGQKHRHFLQNPVKNETEIWTSNLSNTTSCTITPRHDTT